MSEPKWDRWNGHLGRQTAHRRPRLATRLLLVLVSLLLGERLSLGQSKDNALFIDAEGRVGIGKVITRSLSS